MLILIYYHLPKELVFYRGPLKITLMLRKEIILKRVQSLKIDDYLDHNINTGGVGIDVQYSSEFFQKVNIDLKTNDEITSLFTQKEIAYAETRIDPKLTLVGLFSLKEAMFKAGLVDERANNFSELEITHDNNGKPVFSWFINYPFHTVRI